MKAVRLYMKENKDNLTPEQAAGHLIVKLVEQEYRHWRLNCSMTES